MSIHCCVEPVALFFADMAVVANMKVLKQNSETNKTCMSNEFAPSLTKKPLLVNEEVVEMFF